MIKYESNLDVLCMKISVKTSLVASFYKMKITCLEDMCVDLNFDDLEEVC